MLLRHVTNLGRAEIGKFDFFFYVDKGQFETNW